MAVKKKNISIPKFLLFYEKNSEMREMQVPLTRFFQVFLLFILITGFSIFGAAQYLAGIYYKEKIRIVTADNKDLSYILDDMKVKVENLQNQIAVLEQKDKVLRLYADLPEIDQDIRKMGIGGRQSTPIQIDNISEAEGRLINQLDEDLNKLSQNIKLELYSYEKLYETIQGQAGKIEATPSIAPIDRGYVSSSFGYRIDPFTKASKKHYGMDFTAPRGHKIHPDGGAHPDAA